MSLSLAQVKDRASLFGSPQGSIGSDSGGALQQRLLPYDGKPCVVYLDEVDKVSSADILFGFYNLFNDGELEDNRGAGTRVIDCRRHVFLLTCNWAQDIIQAWHREREAARAGRAADRADEPLTQEEAAREDEELREDLAELGGEVRHYVREGPLRAMRGEMGGVPSEPPTAFIGRIDVVLPFVGFTDDEVAVAVWMQLNCMAESFTRPAADALATGPGRHVSGIHVRFSRGLVDLGKKAYSAEDGLRSVRNWCTTIAGRIVAGRRAGSIGDRCVVEASEGAKGRTVARVRQAARAARASSPPPRPSGPRPGP